MSLPFEEQGDLIATIMVQNSQSFFRINLKFEECTLQTEVLEQLCKLLESVAASLEGYGEEESAAYSRAKVTGLRKLKEDVIQAYLGRPKALFGKSPRESKEFYDELESHLNPSLVRPEAPLPKRELYPEEPEGKASMLVSEAETRGLVCPSKYLLALGQLRQKSHDQEEQCSKQP